jgi:hypothetical protein
MVEMDEIKLNFWVEARSDQEPNPRGTCYGQEFAADTAADRGRNTMHAIAGDGAMTY